MRIRLGFGRLDGNHHGARQVAADGEVSFATRRSTTIVVALGRDAWMQREGRKLFGRRLYFYGPSGACIHFDAYLLFRKSPCRPPSKYAPQGDKPTVML